MAKDLETTEAQIQLVKEDIKRLHSVTEEGTDGEDVSKPLLWLLPLIQAHWHCQEPSIPARYSDEALQVEMAVGKCWDK